MKTIQIKATPFFELLKLKDTSMWEIFAQMMAAEEKQELVFLGDKEEILFRYQLPETLEQLQQDQKLFAKEYAEKLEQK